MSKQEEWVPIAQVSQAIFHTDTPTPVQEQQLLRMMAKGVLQANARKSQVTAASLATYLAGSMERRRIAEFEGATAKASRGVDSSAPRSAATATQDRQGKKQLAKAYQFALSDYFAAVFRRRNASDFPPSFRAAVLVGQLILIVLPAVALGWNAYVAIWGKPAELNIVHNWLQSEHGEYDILTWRRPQARPEDGSTIMFVRYQYRAGPKREVAERNFVIKNGAIVAW